MDNDTPLARLYKAVLQKMQQEYLVASAYFRHIGAQTPSAHYGGSRSIVYQELMHQCRTLREIWSARQRYRDCHSAQVSNHDEFGGLLRIVGYRLRFIPWLGAALESKVRADDLAMAQAAFSYPAGCSRVSVPVEVSMRLPGAPK